MRINSETIRKLNPCKSRFDNYLEHCADFDGTLEDFVLMNNITYDDKVWVFTRLATKMQNIKWSLLCASKVLSNFESVFPNDDRPRKALEAVANYLSNPCPETMTAARSAAESAAWLAAESAASAAWSAAESAAESAAWSAEAAARSAEAAARSAEAAAWSAEAAARSAAESAWSVWSARAAEEEVNLLFMMEAVK